MDMKIKEKPLLSIEKYFGDYNKILMECLVDQRNSEALCNAIELLKMTKQKGIKIFLIGNGGSSAIAEHMAIDLIKNAGLRALTISGSPMLTTFSNDYGYERVFQKGIQMLADDGDMLIAISSSGASENILNACAEARKKNMTIITFSGFQLDNPLRRLGDLNLYVNSRSYGYVELIHSALLHYINDAIIGKAEYKIF